MATLDWWEQKLREDPEYAKVENEQLEAKIAQLEAERDKAQSLAVTWREQHHNILGTLGDTLRANDHLKAENERLRAKAAAMEQQSKEYYAENGRLRKALKEIANTNYRDWDGEFANAEEFVVWAKARAQHHLAELEAAAALGGEE